MSGVLNAFLSTWSSARSTFGEGSPQAGATYDNSATLRQLESGLEGAAPGSRWTGSAASAYGTANTEHRQVIGQLAGLDQRLGAQVDQSAQVVAAGRRDLDAVRQWVVAAANSVPPGKAGEQMMLPIVQKGISQVMEVVQRSNGDLNAVGEKIRALGDEYGILGNQRFGPKELRRFPARIPTRIPSPDTDAESRYDIDDDQAGVERRAGFMAGTCSCPLAAV